MSEKSKEKLNENPAVKAQYGNWVYPQPIADLEAWRASGAYQLSDPSFDFHHYWPGLPRAGAETGGLDILVAGCGSSQAACLAFTNPAHRITGVDLSAASLSHSRHLAEKQGLKNLDLRELSLFDVATLGKSFDIIICTGVLHHLPDPLAGGRALKSVLSPGGVLHIMLYGRSLRTGVYLLQEAFSAMDLPQSAEAVAQIRTAIGQLPADHAVRRYAAAANDWDDDGGIVDTFLHPQDRAYSVAEIYDFAAALDMQFLDWQDRGDYAVENAFTSAFVFFEAIRALGPREEAIAVDNLAQTRGTHRFFLCHRDVGGEAGEALARPRFPTLSGTEKGNGAGQEEHQEHWMSYVPIIRQPTRVTKPADWELGAPPVITRGGRDYSVGRATGTLLESVNGANSIGECIAAARSAGARFDEAPERAALRFFSSMQKRGHLLFKCGPAAASDES